MHRWSAVRSPFSVDEFGRSRAVHRCSAVPAASLALHFCRGLCSRAHARRTCDAIWLENAVDGNRQRRTDFAHSIVSEAAETLGERPYRNAFNRIEIDR